VDFLNEIGDAYQRAIVDSGKQAELLLYVAFLVTFAFIRTSAHMIRAQVSWWPGNVETKGGTHIHHLVWGIVALMVAGFCGLALAPDSPWRELLAVLFGIGMGLTLDEFALWLNLEDVYWKPKGRESIDAVIVAAVLGGLVLLGIRIWIDLGAEVAGVVAAAGFVGIALAVVNLLKGKLVMAMASLVVAPVGLIGALRLARPESPWARLYGEQRRERARRRFPEPWLPARIGHHRRGATSEAAPPEPAAGR
jgi:hypothetical protein